MYIVLVCADTNKIIIVSHATRSKHILSGKEGVMSLLVRDLVNKTAVIQGQIDEIFF